MINLGKLDSNLDTLWIGSTNYQIWTSYDILGTTMNYNTSWYHMAIVIDGEKQTNNCSVYQNGQFYKDYCGLVTVFPSLDGTEFFSIGNTDYLLDTYGELDDFGIWNRVLTNQEITSLYNSN